jgi:catechol 2,3-dioxygenase-like lactoylglutathione lyase family enzyme
MQTTQVLETCLYVDDLAAAEEFYSRVLGLVPFSQLEGRHLFFRCGETVFLIFDPAETQKTTGTVPPHGAKGPGHVAFTMEDSEISAWREHLRKNSVPIETEITWPSGGYSIYFRDPAGNSVELATRKTWATN